MPTALFPFVNSMELVLPFPQFAGFISSLKDAAALQDSSTENAIDSLSQSITLQVIAEGSKWPYVLAPFFDSQAEQAQTIIGAETVMMSPIVTEEQWVPWGEYTVLVGDQLSDRFLFVPSEIPPNIYKLEEGANGTLVPSNGVGPGPYSPIWQTYPHLDDASVVNFDMLSMSRLEKLYRAMNDTREPVVSPVMSLSPISDASFEQVHSAIFSPVFERVVYANPSSSNTINANNTPIVANLVLTIAWETYLSFVVSHHMDGAAYVLHNTCGQTFTAQLYDNGAANGTTMNFTLGDEHETVYEHMVETIPVMSFMATHYNSTVGYQACAYELRVYPTQQMRNDFKSDAAVIATTVVGVSFVLVLVIFFFMDRRFQKKKQQIVKSVEKSNAIIASLFPSNVRDRLFGAGGGGDDNASKSSRRTTTSRRSFGFRLRNYLTEGEDADDNGSQSNPIADLFPECTFLIL